MSLSAAQLEREYGERLRQPPFSGADTAYLLHRLIQEQLPRVRVTEGSTNLYNFFLSITRYLYLGGFLVSQITYQYYQVESRIGSTSIAQLSCTQLHLLQSLNRSMESSL